MAFNIKLHIICIEIYKNMKIRLSENTEIV